MDVPLCDIIFQFLLMMIICYENEWQMAMFNKAKSGVVCRPGSMADDKYTYIQPGMVLSSAPMAFGFITCADSGSVQSVSAVGLRYYLNLIGNASRVEWVAVRFVES